MPSEHEIKDIVTRVSAQVLSEVKGREAIFRVGDLHSHVADFGKGGEVAWEVTYKTTSVQLSDSITHIRPLDDVAWSISYSTSKPTLTQRGNEQKN